MFVNSKLLEISTIVPLAIARRHKEASIANHNSPLGINYDGTENWTDHFYSQRADINAWMAKNGHPTKNRTQVNVNLGDSSCILCITCFSILLSMGPCKNPELERRDEILFVKLDINYNINEGRLNNTHLIW